MTLCNLSLVEVSFDLGDPDDQVVPSIQRVVCRLGLAVDEIGREALSMVERSLAAYEAEDSEAAREVVADDDQIDERCRAASETVTRDLIEREADDDGPWQAEQLLDDVTRVLLTIRDVERVADHAVNLAARTVYMVENDPDLIY